MSRDVLARSPALRYWLYRGLFAIAPYVPLRFAQGVGWLCGALFHGFDRRGRRRVADNIRGLITPARRKHLPFLVRRSYCRFGLVCAEGLKLHCLPDRLAHEPMMRITDPWRVLDDPPLKGPGMYCTVHANWELFPPLFLKRGLIDRLHIIALPHGDQRVDDFFYQRRDAVGVESMLLDAAPLASLRALRDGAIFGLVGDRDYTKHGIPVTLAGRATTIPVGPAALALQAGIPIVPVLLGRNGYTRTWVMMGPPVHAEPNLPRRQQIAQLSQRLADWYSRFLRTVPDQWVVFHDQWATGQVHTP